MMKTEILRTLREYKNDYYKTAKVLGTTVANIKNLTLFDGYSEEELGPKKLRDHIVAIQRRSQVTGVFSSGWDNRDPNILQARKDYELGRSEMFTGRTEDTLILYSLPRKKPVKRQPYFYNVNGE